MLSNVLAKMMSRALLTTNTPWVPGDQRRVLVDDQHHVAHGLGVALEHLPP